MRWRWGVFLNGRKDSMCQAEGVTSLHVGLTVRGAATDGSHEIFKISPERFFLFDSDLLPTDFSTSARKNDGSAALCGGEERLRKTRPTINLSGLGHVIQGDVRIFLKDSDFSLRLRCQSRCGDICDGFVFKLHPHIRNIFIRRKDVDADRIDRGDLGFYELQHE